MCVQKAQAMTATTADRTIPNELREVLERLAALGDHEWLEDLAAFARKRLRTVEQIAHEHARKSSL